MNIYLSKFLAQLIYPLNLAIFLVIISIILAYYSRRWLAKFLLFFSITMLWLCSTPFFANYLSASLEQRYLPVPVKDSPTTDAIVVLGGAIDIVQFPRITPELNRGADRVLHAARLYRAGKAPLVIASGGNLRQSKNGTSEAAAMVQLLTEWGVPSEAIIIEGYSLNTYQNALFTQRILEEKELKRVLLVTSASHMRRALATFRSAGIDAIPSPTDYETIEQAWMFLDGLPDSKALDKTTRCLKEYLGFIVYWWRGWINKDNAHLFLGSIH